MAIAPGYVECTSTAYVPGPVATAEGTAIMPVPAAVCGHRYQVENSGTTQVCSCGTFAVGVCQDCGAPVCGDHSLTVGDQRICKSCAQARQVRQADGAGSASARSAVDAVVEEIRGKPDPYL